MGADQQLRQWLESAAVDPQFTLRTEGWERTVDWLVDGKVYRFRFGQSGIRPENAGPQPADLEVELDRATLTDLASGRLHFFLALWSQGRIKVRGAWGDAFRLGYLLGKDQRSGRVAFVAHCWLNLNTRFPGGGSHPGAVPSVVQPLLDSGVGIVQMPCPEFRCFGLEKHRFGQEEPQRVRACFREVAASVLRDLQAYLRLGYEVSAIIGMDPSPSCGVNAAKGKALMLGEDTDASELPGPGLFFAELLQLAQESGIALPPLFGLRRSLEACEPEGLAEVKAALGTAGRRESKANSTD